MMSRSQAEARAMPAAAEVRPPSRADLGRKVAFLSDPSTYGDQIDAVMSRETHMSWVFLAGSRVYKLKKPVHFPYLDFSTLARREAACRAELRLNRRLADDVYAGIAPLLKISEGLAIGACQDGTRPEPPATLRIAAASADVGRIVDWLVVMHRLDERCMLDHAIASGTVTASALDRLVTLLARFYRGAARVQMTAQAHLADWRQSLADNRRALADPRARLPAALVRLVGSIQVRFLRRHGDLLAARARDGRIVDAHGDLRPEHIWLGNPPRIIDCLEFNARLRANDPFDEIAFLALECERLGSPWVARYLRERLTRRVPHPPSPALIAFYRCHRASLRARLAVAHLFDDHPRTPEKWPAQALAYLRLVSPDARRLDALLRR